jgi:hypothetical protein
MSRFLRMKASLSSCCINTYKRIKDDVRRAKREQRKEKRVRIESEVGEYEQVPAYDAYKRVEMT